MDPKAVFSETKPPLSAMGQVVESIGSDSETQVKADNGLFAWECNRLIFQCSGQMSHVFWSNHRQVLAKNCGRRSPKTVACVHHFYPDEQHVTTVATYPNEVSGIGSDQFNEFRIKKEMDTFGYIFDSYTFSEFCDDENKFLKRRGPRTTIKQNQLDVLNRIFSSTPKPSKHARAKLALETGLSMRVIQVWFQNRRSKERRLKHLCNYLRHYEARGLLPPPVQFTTGESGNSSDVTSFSQYLSGIESQFDEDEDED
ncbi:hypothetical protein KIN20_032562 [Parelaphostrongylus tenuis]|uniref:Homeobox domain-containing protein n=1 Tax=Parelaphostrongylus tenuis TaxID=148309 RepID=A0AAD5R785_PARTN|nr:hypothetical protein KIN20_032562 [Parelaphostrongylus tenuis]